MEPGAVSVTLNKPLNSGMGISIVAAKVTTSGLTGGGILLFLLILTITIKGKQKSKVSSPSSSVDDSGSGTRPPGDLHQIHCEGWTS